ncbi:2-oxoacid:acceptor oxidoreductase family protein [Acidiferrimicrobium sp. IK]|uniref:2-oxoacid:acceptor oxidoreductase family protein n=1 Tax=Acidiferrimicrobium sp. IK TaxID=2871700 RepID=UPI0021CB7F60|nr:2-oxoacid:acceptor oxidoreductase family protein [Acidiferrimicrobium sp. IK]MCU4184050.1 2-oxoacid:acceptor oxidoreductase family protein [Acidiferrimicrobium sp. IK]
MFQVRIHGRGGQGAVTAAEILSVAAFLDGHHAQAFPSFGSERMGAPVVAFCRIDQRPIRSHDPVVAADGIVVQDATLLHEVDLFAGLQPDGFVLINSARSAEDLGVADLAVGMPPGHLLTLPATSLALERTGRAVANTALLGGLAALSGVVSLASITEAIRRRFPGEAGRANAALAGDAAGYVDTLKEELSRA